MGLSVSKGDVVVFPFPFSDLSGAKPRPALVLCPLAGDDVVMCQITARQIPDGYSVPLKTSDFVSGRLRQDSAIRVNHLFTADSNTFTYCAGAISPSKTTEVIEKIVAMLRSP